MTAALINDPILDRSRSLGSVATARSGAPAFSDQAMDRWFGADGRPVLQLIEGGAVAAPAVPARRSGAVTLDPMAETYRRRRFAVALALTAIILLATQLAGISLTSFGSTAPVVDETAPQVHVVRPGDTYAGIAAELGADRPVEFGAELRTANGGGELAVGQRLVVNLDALSGLG
ncbi:MAG: LysM domain-containing protein [Actinomycetota bacterium]